MRTPARWAVFPGGPVVLEAAPEVLRPVFLSRLARVLEFRFRHGCANAKGVRLLDVAIVGFIRDCNEIGLAQEASDLVRGWGERRRGKGRCSCLKDRRL